MQGHQVWRLCLVLLLALFTRLLCGAPPPLIEEETPVKEVAPATKLAPAASTTTNSTNSSTTTVTTHSTAPPTIFFSMGTGLAAIDQTAGWVLHWGAMMRPFQRLSLYVGPDFNVHYWGTSPTSGNVTMTGIQAMASGVFAFDLPGTILRSYLGTSFGPFLRNHGGGPIGWTVSWIGRVGMLFLVDNRLALAVEPRFGLMEGSFSLQGLLSAHILL